jgi:hypothetical protein
MRKLEDFKHEILRPLTLELDDCPAKPHKTKTQQDEKDSTCESRLTQ